MKWLIKKTRTYKSLNSELTACKKELQRVVEWVALMKRMPYTPHPKSTKHIARFAEVRRYRNALEWAAMGLTIEEAKEKVNAMKSGEIKNAS
jgi:hypothetical protein